MSIWQTRPGGDAIHHGIKMAREGGFFGPDDTALIVHDVGLMVGRIEDLIASFPDDTLHALAIKANPLPELLSRAVEAGAGLEAASFGEVRLALDAGCAPERIVFDSPAKTRQELMRSLELGVTLNADNFSELERIDALIMEHHSGQAPSRVGLRVNPLVGEGSIGMTSVASADSKFGVPLDGVHTERVLEAYARYPWLTGVHLHVGSQGCDMGMLVGAAERVMRLRERVRERAGIDRITWVDLGGGLPTTYRPEDAAYTMGDYAASLTEAAPSLMGPGIFRVTEFGRAVQAHCGWAISRVEYVKRTASGGLATLHLGADFMLRRAYRPQDWHYTFSVLTADGAPKDAPLEPVTLAGPLCFSGDVLAREVLLPRIDEGDLVCYHDVGGYTLSMWSRYNSRTLPAVVGVDGERMWSLREAESDEDVVAFWRGR